MDFGGAEEIADLEEAPGASQDADRNADRVCDRVCIRVPPKRRRSISAAEIQHGQPSAGKCIRIDAKRFA